MVKVYPKLELQAQHIFKDSAGKRLTLNPAETMDDVEKTPQEFDGEDPIVAAKILEQLDAKTVKVSKGDRKILEDAVKNAGKVSGDKGKATQKEIKTAVDEAVMEATAVANNAHKEAMDVLKAEHEKAMGALTTEPDEATKPE